MQLRILGEHHVANALAALAVARELGIPLERAIPAIEAVPRAERWRMEVLDRGDGVTVINDAYNASPDSTAAAMKTLAQIVTPGQRSVAVLGEMAELGEFAQEEHDRLGRLAVRLNIGKLVVVGERARHIHLAAGLEGSWDGESVLVPDVDAAYDLLREELRPGDVVLVKSSKSAGLRFLGDRLAGVDRVIALLVAAGFSLVFTLFLTPLFIRLFKRLNWGQFIRDDGPQTHHTKRGTPDDGRHRLHRRGDPRLPGRAPRLGHPVDDGRGARDRHDGRAWASIGFLDDFLKTRKQRSLGLGGWSKIVGQVIIGTIFAVLAIHPEFLDENGLTPGSEYVSVVRDVPWLDFFAFGPGHRHRPLRASGSTSSRSARRTA